MEFWQPTHVTATLATDETVMWVMRQKTETRRLKSGDQGRGADGRQAFCDFFFFFFSFKRGKPNNPPQTNIQEKNESNLHSEVVTANENVSEHQTEKGGLLFFLCSQHGWADKSPKRSIWASVSHDSLISSPIPDGQEGHFFRKDRALKTLSNS